MFNIQSPKAAMWVKSHLIFYKVVNDIVEIIRILHQRMDIENQLSD